MSDLIDRQATIDAFAKELSAEHNRREMAVSFLGAKRIIEAVPSVQPQRWIPCSERLPELGVNYVSEPCVVYCDTGAYGFAYLGIFGQQVMWNCERDDEYHEPLGEVVAWMPLHLFNAWQVSSAQEQKGEEDG